MALDGCKPLVQMLTDWGSSYEMGDDAMSVVAHFTLHRYSTMNPLPSYAQSTSPGIMG